LERKNILVFCTILIAGFVCSTGRADDCVRSEPFPAFSPNHKNILEHRFELTSKHVAIERFRLASGMQVEVQHGGCEYFVSRFKFESKELLTPPRSVAGAYKKAAALLQALQRLNPDAGFDLQLAAEALLREAAGNRDPRIDRELPVRGDGVPPLEAVVKVDSVSRLSTAGRIEVTLFRGPL